MRGRTSSRRRVIKAGLSLVAAGALPRPVLSQHRKIRAWEVGEYSRSNESGFSLRLVERPAPTPGPDQVVMKVHATSLNARDLSLLRGVRIYGTQHRASRIPLDDNAGEVLTVGSGVTRVKPGDRVVCTHFPLWVDGAWDESMSTLDFGVNADGFLAEQAVVPAQGLVKIPPNIPFTDAATFPNAGLTAWHAVVGDGQVQRGETVLTLGSGGVSVFGMQWAKLQGARVIITSSSDTKLERLRALGADDTINYRSHPDWHEQLLEKTGGKGANAVLNTVGIGEMDRCLRSCASNGRVMLIGVNPVRRGVGANEQAESVGLKDFPRDMIMKGLTIKGVIVGSRRMLEDLILAAAKHNVRPVVDRTFSFENVLDALRYMQSGKKIGKIVIRIA